MSAEQCIVCLGDLAVGEPPPPSPHTTAEAVHGNDASTIAYLLPCQHYLHNACLKPWVERANSCPLCRQAFNVVELKATIHGPCLDSYTVQDKQQVAEIDPFMVIDQELLDEPAPEPCLLCLSHGDEDNLLACDSCSSFYHIQCVGEEAIPSGHWFCQHCWEDGTAMAHPRRALPISSRRNARRAVPLAGIRRNRNAARRRSPSPYAALRSTIHQRANFDLDFPFPDDSTERTTDEAEWRIWSQRMNIAERQGAASHFRESANTILSLRSGRVDRTPTPTAEQQEETRAWQAFERARDSQVNNPQRGKRPSVSPPVEAQVSNRSERPLKRPRLNRFTAENSARPATASSQSRNTTAQGPSFLQSLLAEVQQNSDSGNRTQRPLPLEVARRPDYLSHSPLSPISSNHSSPRHMSPSPPPDLRSRPTSPTPLSCTITPTYLQRQAFSPVSPGHRSVARNSFQRLNRSNNIQSREMNDDDEAHDTPSVATSRIRNGANESPSSPQCGPALASDGEHTPADTSRTRSEMTFDAKSEIRNMVSAALKPSFAKEAINTSQYTDINRQVSRKLYDRVGEVGGIKTAEDRARWKFVAVVEVEAALKELARPEAK